MRKIIVIVCAAVMAVSLCVLGVIYYGRYQESRTDRELQALVRETPAPTATPSPTPAPTPAAPTATPEPTPTPAPVVLDKYLSLYEENPDTIGWLKIEDTAIDYVVMQTPEDPEKYLHIDFYGNPSNRGTLFLDFRDDIQSSDNLIIYGHHMQSSAMFGHLEYFASEDYWKEHKYIQFDTIYEEQTYEIVGAFYARILGADEKGFRYYYFFDADNAAEFDAYAAFIDENQCYDTGVDIEYGDRLLTLSTCAYHTQNGRFAVVAKKLPADALPPAD